MKKYSYQEFAEGINMHFKNIPDVQITVRTVKFWVKEGILPEPKGGGRWRYFEDDDLQEAVSIRKLQVVYRQSLEDIKGLIELTATSPHTIKSGNTYNLSKLVSAIEPLEKTGINPLQEVEALKNHDRLLVRDDAYTPPYRLIKIRQFKRTNDRYYMISNTPVMASQMTTDKEFLEDVKKEITATWYHQSMKAGLFYSERLEFAKDDLQLAKDLLKNKLVYPRILKGDTPVYEWSDTSSVISYLTIMKFFKGTLTLDILKRLRKRFIENAQEILYLPETYPFEVFDEAEIGFRKEDIANNLLIEFSAIISYLAYSKKDTKSRYLFYANKYFNIESLLALYFHGFCHFVFSNAPGSKTQEYLLKDRDISELSIEQIEQGLKENILTREGITKRISKLEADLKGLKSIVKQSLKGDGHGRKN